MREKKGYVYILTNRHNTVLYTGVTGNLVKRIYEHKNKEVEGFTPPPVKSRSLERGWRAMLRNFSPKPRALARGAGFTNKYNLNKLVYYEVFEEMVSAISREKQIKGWLRNKKISLIESINPAWADLYASVV